MTDKTQKETLFWDLAEPLLANGVAERGTIMGFPCLRVDGKFFASLERATGNLIVKLSAERVTELVGDGEGLSFAPNGRVFREWVAFDTADTERWSARLEEARQFVSGEKKNGD